MEESQLKFETKSVQRGGIPPRFYVRDFVQEQDRFLRTGAITLQGAQHLAR